VGFCPSFQQIPGLSDQKKKLTFCPLSAEQPISLAVPEALKERIAAPGQDKALLMGIAIIGHSLWSHQIAMVWSNAHSCCGRRMKFFFNM
jgi:hypothetical protein